MLPWSSPEPNSVYPLQDDFGSSTTKTRDPGPSQDDAEDVEMPMVNGFLVAMTRSTTEQARTTTEMRRVRSQMAPGLTRRENMRCRRLVEASPLLQSQRWKRHHSLLPLNEAVGVYSDGCIRGEY
jgi:hypothetical protein